MATAERRSVSADPSDSAGSAIDDQPPDRLDSRREAPILAASIRCHRSCLSRSPTLGPSRPGGLHPTRTRRGWFIGSGGSDSRALVDSGPRPRCICRGIRLLDEPRVHERFGCIVCLGGPRIPIRRNSFGRRHARLARMVCRGDERRGKRGLVRRDLIQTFRTMAFGGRRCPLLGGLCRSELPRVLRRRRSATNRARSLTCRCSGGAHAVPFLGMVESRDRGA